MQLNKKISAKIARIRLEPEHVRLRWVWGAVAVSMLFVLTIWIFSIGSLFKGEKNTTNQKSSNAPDITQQLESLKQQAPSIKDFSEISAVKNKGAVTDIDDELGQAYPAATDMQAATQSSMYLDSRSSDLSQ